MSIILSIIVFSLIVIVHELGHFLVAKKVGIYVQEFAVGMGPVLVSKHIGETQYSLRMFPFGGFCRMQGEDGDENDGKVNENYDPSRSFSSKTVLQRMAVIFSGPAMNFVLAFVLIFIILGLSGFFVPKINTVIDNSPAQEAGLESGDTLLRVNGQRILIYQDYTMALDRQEADSPIEYVILHDGEKKAVTVTPEYSEENGRYMVGFTFDANYGMFGEKVDGYTRAGIAATTVADVGLMSYFVKSVIVGFVKLFSFQVKSDEVSGPIGIIGAIGDSYEAGIKSSNTDAFINLATLSALLSTNLGVLNLFPIPAMDGGRLAFLIVEGIRRKPVNPEIEGRIHFAGFMLLMAFMVVVAFNDIVNIIR
ncbi:MAG: site-2 protease family protein [Candidatus Metalachnospira sp.]|nr:site-2 protease family protein [Candidatus Metalachnospira sp.]